MKKRNAIGWLFAFTGLIASGIIFNGFSHEDVDLTAESLPESRLYVAPAGINPANSYQNSPTNEPWYSSNHYFTNTNDPTQPHSYSFSQKDTTYERMNVPTVWNSYRGEGVKVAVIDTGCMSTHEDFSSTDFTLSKNVYSGSTSATSWTDSSGHGTASAATIAAAINSVGGSGIAPNVQLIVLKCVDSSNNFNTAAINNALQYCIDNKVDIINMSIQGYNVASNFDVSYFEDWGEFQYNTTSVGIITPSAFSAKLQKCYENNITVVASAGNFNTNKESYPAANDHVIAVASTGMKPENKYNKAGFSNYGSWVDISAPGYVTAPYITTTIPYTVQYGTSFSAPLVTGAIALYKSKYPYAKPDQIEKALKETAYSINWEGGAGAINVGAFLDYVPVESVSLDLTEKTLTVGQTFQLASTISPSSATDKDLVYYSVDEDVCTVSETGLITATGVGECLVEVASEEDSHVGNVISITVEEDPYYPSSLVSLEGDNLLNALRSLNTTKKTKNVGYSSMGTSPSGQFKYTDYDTSTVQYDSKGQPYGTKLIAFYSGTSTTSTNREHVWPNTHGGNLIEDDIHMPRPTIQSENGSRGHSFFVENMKSNNNTGWDPAMESFGDETYRGDSARIIFYSMVASDQLTLTDDQSRSSNTNNKEMGVISDMLSWNLRYPVLDREKRRNEGAEYLQGNRNPFIDHPEYACKIWGNFNDKTRTICGVGNKTLLSLTSEGNLTTTIYEDGDSFNPTGLTIYANFDTGSPVDVTSSVTWTPSPLSVGTTSVTGSYTYGSETKTIVINGLTVTESTSGGDEGTTYTKVTSNLSDWSGEYLITYETGSTAKVWTGVDANNSYVDATISNNKIEKPDGAQSVTISTMSGGYSIKVNGGDNKGQYMGGTSNSNTINFSNFAILNTISYSSSATNIMSNTSGLRYNPASGNNRFRYFKSSTYSNMSAIQLYKLDASTPKVKSISIVSALSLDVYNNKTYTIIPTITADEGADTTVTWSSSDQTVASITSAGLVTALKAGSTTITATCGGKSATCTLSVTDSTPVAVSGVSLNKDNLVLTVGSSETLIATVLPTNATNKNVTWSTSNSGIATVNNGVVQGVSVGTATITVTTVDGNKTDTCTVTVNAAPVITYELEADVNEVPFMSGINHVAAVGIKLYQYSNGQKGSSVYSGNANVDTSSLGYKSVSYTYQNQTYYAQVKVTNNGTTYSEQTLTPHSTSFNLSNDNGKKFSTSNKTVQGWTVSLGGTTNVEASGNGSSGYNKFGSGSSSFSSLIFSYALESSAQITNVSIKCCRSGTQLSTNLVAYTLDSNNNKVYLVCSSSTTIPTGTSVSSMKTFTFAPSANTVATGTVYIGVEGSSGGKQLYVNNLSCSYSTVTGSANDFTLIEQAKAWGEYFIDQTRTQEVCLADTDAAKLSGLQSKWADLAYEYNHMVSGAKDVFFTSDDSKIVEARSHYLFIVSKFGASSLGDDGAFVKDSNDHVLQAKANNVFNMLKDDS